MDPTWYQKIAAVEAEYWWNVARRNILSGVLASLRLPSGASILEAGCGSGGNLELLSAFGQLDAFEKEAAAIAFALERQVCDVRCGSLPAEIPFSKEYDLIAMLDVLEHIEDDRGVLESLAPYLKPGGRLLLTVPAYMFLWSNHDVVNHHQRRYTLGGLKETLQSAGYESVYSTYFNTLLFPAQVLARIFQPKVAPEEVKKKLPNPLLNKFLKAVFSSERFVLPTISLPYGGSVLVVAELARP